jgi:amidase
MTSITRRALGASVGGLAFAGLAARAQAQAPAVKTAWPDAVETAAMIKDGRTTAEAATRTAIEAALKLQPKLNFLVASDFDRALDRAKPGGLSGAFGGVPFLIKDLDDFAGTTTRSGSRAMMALPPARTSAPLVDGYVRSGLNVIGKSSTPEFGFLPTTEPVGFGPTRNPWDLGRSSGGSSGGAAAAVAAGVVPAAHASDGGGSIRIPSSCCGVLGLKPSRGRMIGSRNELQVTNIGVQNVLSRTVRDSAALFAATEDSGPGARFKPVGLVTQPLRRRLRVGLVIEGGAGKAPSPEVRAATEAAAKLMESLGHRIETTRWPIAQTFINDFLLLWGSGAADAADSIGKMRGKPADGEVLEPFSLGMAKLARDAGPAALPATNGRLTQAAAAYDPWFDKGRFDVILSPVLAWAAPPLGEVGPNVPFDTLIERLIEYVGYTTYHNVAGGPAISVPLGWTPGGLPVGAQFAARVGQEGLLLQLAYQLELAQPWAGKVPPVRA